jgi:hypothetical protein
MITKLCKKCQRKLSLDQFAKKGQRNGKQRYKTSCKTCDNKRRWEQEKVDNGYRNKLRRWLTNYKSKLSCTDCHLSFEGREYLCDFHHINDKVDSITTMVTFRKSKEEILEEIKKCVPLCANCHRTRHYGSKVCENHPKISIT